MLNFGSDSVLNIYAPQPKHCKFEPKNKSVNEAVSELINIS